MPFEVATTLRLASTGPTAVPPHGARSSPKEGRSDAGRTPRRGAGGARRAGGARTQGIARGRLNCKDPFRILLPKKDHLKRQWQTVILLPSTFPCCMDFCPSRGESSQVSGLSSDICTGSSLSAYTWMQELVRSWLLQAYFRNAARHRGGKRKKTTIRGTTAIRGTDCDFVTLRSSAGAVVLPSKYADQACRPTATCVVAPAARWWCFGERFGLDRSFEGRAEFCEGHF